MCGVRGQRQLIDEMDKKPMISSTSNDSNRQEKAATAAADRGMRGREERRRTSDGGGAMVFKTETGEVEAGSRNSAATKQPQTQQ